MILHIKKNIINYNNSKEIVKENKYIICHEREKIILTEEYAKIYNKICYSK